MNPLWQDIRYGFRGLRNRPGFAFLAVLTLALGIGAVTTIFSVLYNVLLDPTPYRDAHRIVSIQVRDATNPDPGGRMWFQTAEFLDYREQTTVRLLSAGNLAALMRRSVARCSRSINSNSLA